MKRRNLKSRKGITVCSFPATKPAQRMIFLESILERDACYLFELDDSVISYDSQPEPIRYMVGEEAHHYTADFIVTFDDGEQVLYEVKDSRYLESDTLELLDLISEYARANGYGFKIITDESIRKRPLFTNLKHLFDVSTIAPLLLTYLANY